MIKFADYGVESVEKNRTYVLVLSQTAPSSPFSADVITIPVKDGVSIEMVKVEPGTFMMGEADENKRGYEHPVHQVILTDNYYIGQYEVTQVLWQAVMESNPSTFKGDNLPVEKVSWNDCQDFISKLNSMTGKKFRLPTEEEWEYAARGGKNTKGYQYSGSSNISDVAWYDGNSDNKTHPVGTKEANELGIYDMSGNVDEWCQDRVGSSCRVYRGGGWYYGEVSCLPSYGSFTYPSSRFSHIGLRLALSE